MTERVELLLEERDGRQRLSAPAVGLLTGAHAAGELLVEGQDCGTLLVLGRAHTLVAPAGTRGRIANAPPERLHAPLSFGTCVYELEPLSAEPAAARAQAELARTSSALVLRSPQTGRFYHRPGPGEPAFVEAGRAIGEGQPVGLIEVMKTFTHVVHRASGALPASVRVVRYLVADGADVKQGQPLVEYESA